MVKEEKKREMPFPFRLPQQVALQLADVIAKAVVARIPRDVFKRKKRKKTEKVENALILDTSAIIDGRIYEVAKLGFLAGNIFVPDFILSELKKVADANDGLKRARGRRGLELLDKLRKIKGIKFRVLDNTEDVEGKDVDDRLVSLTKRLKGRLITCDFNLNKKASIEGVKVLNVNELANSLKTVALPGEEMRVSLVSVGRSKEQGVGYLPDGTMIVVEDGKDMIGKEVDVVVSRVFQTVAGRMIFAKLKT